MTDKMIRGWIDGKEIVAVNHKDRRVGTRIETAPESAAGLRDLGNHWRVCETSRSGLSRPRRSRRRTSSMNNENRLGSGYCGRSLNRVNSVRSPRSGRSFPARWINSRSMSTSFQVSPLTSTDLIRADFGMARAAGEPRRADRATACRGRGDRALRHIRDDLIADRPEVSWAPS